MGSVPNAWTHIWIKACGFVLGALTTTPWGKKARNILQAIKIRDPGPGLRSENPFFRMKIKDFVSVDTHSKQGFHMLVLVLSPAGCKLNGMLYVGCYVGELLTLQIWYVENYISQMSSGLNHTYCRYGMLWSRAPVTSWRFRRGDAVPPLHCGETSVLPSLLEGTRNMKEWLEYCGTVHKCNVRI